jgi:hypothetical protein
MNSIQLEVTPIDDPAFVNLVSIFVSHYTDVCQAVTVRVVHITNWFGDRWLGFQGKVSGAAGVRNRNVNDCTLPAPPFKPSRIHSALEFHRDVNSHYTVVSDSIAGLHADKPGSEFWYLTRPGIYSWYSGNTNTNTTGSLMIYEVSRESSSGWYIGFDRNPDWRPVTAKNVSLEECEAIVRHASQLDAAEQTDEREAE